MLPQRLEPKHGLSKLVDFILFIVFKMDPVVPGMNQSGPAEMALLAKHEDLTLDAHVKARRVSSLVLGAQRWVRS